MADRGGGDAWPGRPEREAASDTGSLSASDSDSDSDWAGQESRPAPGEPFRLRGTSSTFALRSRSIFQGLEGAAGAGPAAQPPTRVPDYVTHPERWTRYSLEAAPEGSDRSNRAVAPQACAPAFNQEPWSRGAGRMVFSRPRRAAERRRPPGRGPGQEPVALGHLRAAGGPDPEAEEPRPERPGAEPAGAAGFRGRRKRRREHLRPQGQEEREEEEEEEA